MSKSSKPAPATSSKLYPPPPYSSLDPNTSTSTKGAATKFADRINLFSSQAPNPDILSILIVVVLTTANPHTETLTLYPPTIATLSLDHAAVIKPLKRGLKRQDPHQAAEWEHLDIFLIRELMQHIFLHQEHPDNSLRAWLPVCRAVRPCYRGLGRGWWYGCTVGVARVVANLPRMERLRKEEEGGVEEGKGYLEFKGLWTMFFAAKWVKDLQ